MVPAVTNQLCGQMPRGLNVSELMDVRNIRMRMFGMVDVDLQDCKFSATRERHAPLASRDSIGACIGVGLSISAWASCTGSGLLMSTLPEWIELHASTIAAQDFSDDCVLRASRGERSNENIG